MHLSRALFFDAGYIESCSVKRFVIGGLAAGLFLWVSFSGMKPAETPPNIIFIIADDVSLEDIGVYGNKHIRTPHIDRLAGKGLRFNNVFLTASSCSPSRISILTGRYPHNTGAAELHTEAPRHLVFFPEVLKNAGYFTALAGKWHEGRHSARAYDTLLVDRKANGEGGEAQWLSLLKSVPRDRPFFFWLSPYDAHRDWSADSAFARPYKPEEVYVPEILVDDADTRRDLASYYNEITRMDEYIGKLIVELERRNLLDNTLIVFTSDNPRAFTGSKTRLRDNGIRTPFVVHWPKGIRKAGHVAEALISSIDIAPTLLQAAGVQIPREIQGKSFFELISQPEHPFRQHVFAEHNWHDYEAYERAVRTADYLYVLNERNSYTNEGPIDAVQSPAARSLKARKAGEGLTATQREAYIYPRPREELYDNRKDPAQVYNLIGEKAYQEAAKQLRQTLRQWREETGDTLPDSITRDWYHRETGQALKQKGIRGEMPGAALRADTITSPGPF